MIRKAILLLLLVAVGAGAYFLMPQQPARSPDVPYVETPPRVIEAMLDLGEVTAEDIVYDLGSGDGRMAIAAGQRGATALGIEIDPVLVKLSRKKAKEQGVDDRVRFETADLLETDMSEASVVMMYLSPRINRELRPKLLEELKPGSRVMSHIFDMDDWEPDELVILEGRKVFLWRIPEKDE